MNTAPVVPASAITAHPLTMKPAPMGVLAQPIRSDSGDKSYVLLTAAYNEEHYIEETLASVLSQTLPPRRWVIVSDGSTDGTDALVERYAKDHKFIRFLRVSRPPGRNFRFKALALRAGSELLEDIPYSYIGNIDADVSVGPRYFEDLIHYFEQDPILGLAAGFVYEQWRGEFRIRNIDRVYSVCHAAQLVRRECYAAIGGYAALRYGGEDWHAQTSAKMQGWHVRAVPTLKIMHHRHTGAAEGVLRDRFRLGRLAYSLGSHPLFEAIKSLRLIPNKPLLIGALVRFMGFVSPYFQAESRVVSDQFVAFLRNEQRERICSSLRHVRSLLPKSWRPHAPRKPARQA